MQYRQHEVRIARSIRVFGMARDTDKPILSQRARRPHMAPGLGEPPMGDVMMHVHGISQGKEKIDIQEIGRHSASSRSWLISSRVTTPASA